MRTPTQLDGGAVFHDAHLVAIFFTEQCHCAHLLGLVDWHIPVFFQLIVGADLLAHQFFHLPKLFVGYLLEMGEVETQCFGRNIGTFLLDMLAQDLAQGLVEQVRSRVVAFTLDALFPIDFGGKDSGHVGRQLLNDVDRKVVLALRVEDGNLLIAIDQPTRIADLSTHLGVERSFVEHQLVKRFVLLLHLAVAQNFGIAIKEIVADEFRLAFFQDHPVAGFHGSSVAGTFFLFLHLHVELVDIHVHAMFAENQLGQVERETIRIV